MMRPLNTGRRGDLCRRRRERGQESARGGEDEAAQQMPVEADEARADW